MYSKEAKQHLECQRTESQTGIDLTLRYRRAGDYAGHYISLYRQCEGRNGHVT